MTTINASISNEKYKTTLTSATNTVIADEPKELGGADLGFTPFELLSGALASCTAITMRMYAERKNWDTGVINVQITMEQPQGGGTVFTRHISLGKQVDESTQNRLLTVANACPTHKLLSGAIEINTKLVN